MIFRDMTGTLTTSIYIYKVMSRRIRASSKKVWRRS